ncbi:MAG TPA: exodeoxyribonuclease VII small subunit [Clostridia bacterium]|nr:exodeoxyribonuclease VII small subunit [Clostridia bacterium]
MNDKDKKDKLDKQDMTYEEAIKRLEEIVSLLERSEQALDQSMDLFREGVALASFCRTKLDTMKEEIVKLVDAEGTEEPLG